jgi:hypothetical protein
MFRANSIQIFTPQKKGLAPKYLQIKNLFYKKLLQPKNFFSHNFDPLNFFTSKFLHPKNSDQNFSTLNFFHPNFTTLLKMYTKIFTNF